MKFIKKSASILLVLLIVLQMFSIAVGEGFISTLSVEAASGGEEVYIPEARMEHNGHTYALFTNTVTWSEAVDICNTLGGHLATFQHYFEWDIAEALIKQTNTTAWIGHFQDSKSNSYLVTTAGAPKASWFGKIDVNGYQNDKYTMEYTTSSNTLYSFICEWEGVTSSEKFSETKITIYDANGAKVPNAKLVVFSGSMDYMKASKKHEFTADTNGVVTIDMSQLTQNGWSYSEIQNAYYTAYKDYIYKDNGRGSYFPNNERYVVRMSSEKINSNGLWCGKELSNCLNGSSEISMNIPRIYFNLVVAFDSNVVSKCIVHEEIVATSKALAQATDGFAMIGKVKCVSCNSKKETEKYNADIKVYNGAVTAAHTPLNDNSIDFISGTKRYYITIDTNQFVDYKSNERKNLTHELGHYLFDFKDEYTNYYKITEDQYRYDWDSIPNGSSINDKKIAEWLKAVGVKNIQTFKEGNNLFYIYKNKNDAPFNSISFLFTMRLNNMGRGDNSSPFGLMEINTPENYELSSQFDYRYLSSLQHRTLRDKKLTKTSSIIDSALYLYYGYDDTDQPQSGTYYFNTKEEAYSTALVWANYNTDQIDEYEDCFVVFMSINDWNEYAQYQFEAINSNDSNFYQTAQYYYATQKLGLSSGSCWDQLVYVLKNSYCSKAGAPCGNLSDYIPKTAAYRTASYDYAGNVTFVNLSGASAANTNIAALSSISGFIATADTMIADIAASVDDDGNVNLNIEPLITGGDYSLSYESYENGETFNIALVSDGVNYTATIPASCSYGSLALTVSDGETSISNELLIECSAWEKYDTATSGKTFSSEAEFYFDESSANQYFTAEFENDITAGDYFAVSDVIIIGTDTSTEPVGSMTMYAPFTGIDYTSPAIFKYLNGEWVQLDTMLGTETESGRVSAMIEYAGAGMYCLMAKEAVAEELQPVSNIEITYPENGGNTVTINFKEHNDNIRYYNVYVSENEDFDITDSDVECSRNSSSGTMNITVGESNKNYYVAIKAVAETGAESSLSEVFVINTQPSDRDADGIPDEYCDNFGLWGFDDEVKDIASSDEDGDGLTNLEEYTFGSNPIVADTDGDGVDDSMELAKGLDPNNQITDGVNYDYVVVYGNPDLYVNNEGIKVSPLTYNAGDQVALSITVGNNAIHASTDVHVYAKCGSEIVGEWMVSVLGDESVTFDTTFTALGDTENIVVVVDENREGYDSDYSNNTYTFVPLSASEAELVQAVLDAIEALPLVVSADDYTVVESTYKKYTALSNKLKEYVYPSYVEKLESSYAIVMLLASPFSDELIEKVANRMFDFSGRDVDLSEYNQPFDAYTFDAIKAQVRKKYPVEYDIANIAGSTGSGKDGLIKSMSFMYYDTSVKNNFDTKVAAFNKKIATIREGIAGLSDFEKIIKVHDYLVLNAKYDETLSKHTGYDLVVNHIGVCESYTKAFHIIMTLEGIECICLTSYDMNHAWNMVLLDGEWYHIDATWDDPIPDRNGVADYAHTLLNDTEITKQAHYEWSPRIDANSTLYSNMPRGTSRTQYLYDGMWYFFDASSGDIKTCDAYGNNVQDTGLISTGGIEVYNDVIYYGYKDCIKSYNLNTGKSGTVYALSESEKSKSDGPLFDLTIDSLTINENGILSYKFQVWVYNDSNGIVTTYNRIIIDGENTIDLMDIQDELAIFYNILDPLPEFVTTQEEADNAQEMLDAYDNISYWLKNDIDNTRLEKIEKISQNLDAYNAAVEKQKLIEEFYAVLDSLPENITTQEEADAAQEMLNIYNEFTEEIKAGIDSEYSSKVARISENLDNYNNHKLLEAFYALLNPLPETVTTQEQSDAAEEMFNAYNKLSEEIKADIDSEHRSKISKISDNLDTYKAAVEKQKALEAFYALLDPLPETITTQEEADAAEEMLNAYNKLSEEIKADIDSEHRSKISKISDNLDTYKAAVEKQKALEAFYALLDPLPETVTTQEEADTAEGILNAYNKLYEEIKADIDSEHTSKISKISENLDAYKAAVEKQKALESFYALLDPLSETVTTQEEADAAEEMLNAYNKLSEEIKADIDSEHRSKISKISENLGDYNDRKALDAFYEILDPLPESIDNYAESAKARAVLDVYNALTDKQKSNINKTRAAKIEKIASNLFAYDANIVEIGFSGGCTWIINQDGLLTIEPTNGVNGILDNCIYSGEWEWTNYQSIINKVVIKPGVIGNESCAYMFYGMDSCVSIDISELDTSNVSNAECMFGECTSLRQLDLSNFNTSSVTDMRNMFGGCCNLTELDISNFDTSNVTDMSRMFVRCSGLTKLDLSNFDTSNVIDMAGMFDGCINLTELDLRSFNTSRVTDMSYMFSDCSSLPELIDNNFDTSSVTNMFRMFFCCNSLKEADVSGWDTSDVADMSQMFINCGNLKKLDVSGWDISNVTNMSQIFSGCSNLEKLDVSGWDTSNVTNMRELFCLCENLEQLDVSKWNTSNVTDMGNMFLCCKNLNKLDVDGFDTSNATNMNSMFGHCSSLTELDVSSWDTSNVTDMGNIFYGCSSLAELDVSEWDTASALYINSMFGNCSSLTELDVSGFNTSNVTYMYGVFDGCSNLIELDVSKWNTSNVTNMSWMFAWCANLKEVDISNFDTSNVTDMSYIFHCSDNLTKVNISGFDTSNVIDMTSMFGWCTSLTELEVGTGWKPALNYEMMSETNAFNVVDGNLFYQPYGDYEVRSVTIHNGAEDIAVDLDKYPESYPNFTGDLTATIIFDKEKLAKPTNLYAYTFGYTSIRMTWDAVEGAEGYEIFRCDRAGQPYNYVDTVSADAGETAYRNIGLSTGTTYYYKVRAYKTLEDGTKLYSDLSAYSSARPLPATPVVTAVRTSATTANISWVKIYGATGYSVYYSTEENGTYKFLANLKSGDTTTYKATGLASAKTYYYKVRAYRQMGDDMMFGSYSKPAAAFGAPAVPTITARSVGYTSAKVLWDPVKGADGYAIYRCDVGGGAYSYITSVGADVTTYTNTGLSTGTTYYYKVRAFVNTDSGKLYSNYSPCATARPLPATPVVTVTADDANNATISWVRIYGATGYSVYRSTEKDGTYSFLAGISSGDTVSYTDKNTDGQTYYYKVRAYRQMGKDMMFGEYSKPAYVK